MEKEVVKKPQYINLVLEWYQKTGDSLIGEEIIMKFPTKKAHEILGVTDKKDYFICDAYPLDKEKADIFQKYVSHTIDLLKYDYFIGGIRDEDVNLYKNIK